MIELTNDDFWNNPFKSPPRIRPASEIEIAAPDQVAIGTRETLPVVVHRAGRVSEMFKTSFPDLAVVSAIDVQRNVFFAGFAVDRDEVPLPRIPPEPAPGETLVDGKTVQPYVVDARRATSLAWRPARYLLTVHLRGQDSNRVVTRVGAPPTAYQDPAVDEYVDARTVLAGPAPAWPDQAHELPTFHRREDSPAPPEGTIALEVERVVVLRRASRAIVRGAFRLPLVKGDFVPPGPPGHPVKRPHAILGIHLLVVGSEDATPLVLPIRVPIWDPPEAAGAVPMATGFFAFDLFTLLTPSTRGQTYFLHAFCREQMVGPVAMATITPDMLPPGIV
jgi:hypothetical protein